MLNIVLVNPEIPPNTGNIGRLSVAVGARLHLIKPLGFQIDDRSLKRAGLDYWKKLDLKLWENFQAYANQVDTGRVVLTSSKRGSLYTEVEFRDGDHIIFGPETTGLGPEVYSRFPLRIARIPIKLDMVRSLNLSTSVGIIVFEALRQTDALKVL